MGGPVFVEAHLAGQLDDLADGRGGRLRGSDARSADLLLGQDDQAAAAGLVRLFLRFCRRAGLFAVRFLYSFGLSILLPENDCAGEQQADEYDAQNGVPGLLIDIDFILDSYGLFVLVRLELDVAPEVGHRAVAVGQRAQVLGPDLEQGPLCIEHVQEAELAGLEARDRCLIRRLRNGKDVGRDAGDLLLRQTSALIGFAKRLANTQPFGIEVAARLVSAPQRGQQVALVAVEQRQRDGHTDYCLIAADLAIALAAERERDIGHALGAFQPHLGPCALDLLTRTAQLRAGFELPA